MAVKQFKFLGQTTALAAALAALVMPVMAAAQDGEDRGRMREAPGHIGGDDSSRPAPQPRADTPGWGGGRRQAQASAPAAAPAPSPEPARRGGWSRPDSSPASQPDGGGRRGGWSRPDDSAGAQADGGGRRGGWSRPDIAPAPTAQADGGGRRSGGWWSGGRSRTPEAVPAPRQAEQPPINADRRGAWGGRNGTYTDPQRGETARREDRRRDDGQYRDGRRDGQYRDDSRDGRREGYRDGSRSGTWWGGDRDRRSNDDWRRDRRGDDRQGYRGDHRRWDRDWRRDRRYDWNSYRRYNRNSFSIGLYYAPYRNYSYSRLSIGYFLDSLFLSNRYWINDPWQYRLPEVYGPYRWVRYYNDVVLVDVYTGEVVDVIHDFFW
jgi:Nickel/cobalt transporter regulator